MYYRTAQFVNVRHLPFVVSFHGTAAARYGGSTEGCEYITKQCARKAGKKQRGRLKENKKATKKIDAPVIAFGAELIKDKEGELSWSVDGTRVASMAAAQRKRRV